MKRLTPQKSGTTFVAAVAVLVGIQPMVAQSHGDRVRVTTDEGSRVIGRLLEVTEDRIDLDLSGGQSVSVTRDEILRFERSRGRPVAAGALWGGLIGGGLGALAGYGASCVFNCGDETPEITVMGAFWGGLIGGGLGALGALILGRERWEVVAVDGTASAFAPIIDLQLDHGRSAAVLGARLRL